jgi:NAD-dependent SIR2 family protein deacetylase
MPPHVLPDSRARDPKDVILTPEGNVVRIYCANCGTPWGRVLEQHITFAFALCNKCAETYGDDAHFYLEPDHVFWERVHNAQLETFGRILTADELRIQLDDPTTVLAKLAAEWRKTVEKTQ